MFIWYHNIYLEFIDVELTTIETVSSICFGNNSIDFYLFIFAIAINRNVSRI